MENISKALLIAGGVLFAILVLTLLIIFRGNISSYFTEQHNAKILEQVTEFNNKFENYNGQTIRGSELISVMNRVVDYNRTYSDIQGAEKVIIRVEFPDNHQKDLLYTGVTMSSSDILFANSAISNVSGDDNISRISGLSSELATSTGIDDTKLQKLSANISIICSTSTDPNDVNIRNEKLQKILGYRKGTTVEGTELRKIQSATLKYYQLTQFKRTMFKCTDVVHDQKSGRINKISFQAVVENGMLKQD